MQSKKSSVIESFVNVISGFGISVILLNVVLPLLGISIDTAQSVIVTFVFAVVSFARAYIIRRIFNKSK